MWVALAVLCGLGFMGIVEFNWALDVFLLLNLSMTACMNNTGRGSCCLVELLHHAWHPLFLSLPWFELIADSCHTSLFLCWWGVIGDAVSAEGRIEIYWVEGFTRLMMRAHVSLPWCLRRVSIDWRACVSSWHPIWPNCVSGQWHVGLSESFWDDAAL